MKTSENKTLECIYLPSTQRQDGSFRKPIKIKPGFIPKEEIPKYTIPIKKANNLQKKFVNGVCLSRDQFLDKFENLSIKEEVKEYKKSEFEGDIKEKPLKESEDMGKKDGDNGKKLKIFNKKLRQIQYLKEKFERGEALTEHEKEKLEKKSEFEKKAQLILNALP